MFVSTIPLHFATKSKDMAYPIIVIILINSKLSLLLKSTIDSISIHILAPSQIAYHFDFSNYIVFAIHLHIHYALIHSNTYVSNKVKKTYNFK